jgi:hypothetical protein
LYQNFGVLGTATAFFPSFAPTLENVSLLDPGAFLTLTITPFERKDSSVGVYENHNKTRKVELLNKGRLAALD